MNTALFVIYPITSHYNSCFGYAANLRKKKYRVVFTGVDKLKEHIEANGFEFIAMQYISELSTPFGLAALGAFITFRVDKLRIKNHYRHFIQEVSNFQNICDVIKPDKIYLDEHLNHYYLISKSKSDSTTLLNTMLPTRRVKGIPPLICSLSVKSSVLYTIYSWLSWQTYLKKRLLSKKINNFIYNGYTSNKWLIRLSKKLHIYYRLGANNAFYDSITTLPIINLVPRQIEYDWYQTREDEQFIFYPYKRNFSWNDSVYNEYRLWMSQRNSSTQKKIVYSSLGTLNSLYIQSSIHFISKLIEVARQLANIDFVISAAGLRSSIHEALPTNVAIFDWVPQQKLLKHCAAMITHGGMNSICECLVAGVPMLVYPLNLNSDQPGNAARINAKGWGLKGNLRTCSNAQLLKKIEKILANSHYRENILKVASGLKMED